MVDISGQDVVGDASMPIVQDASEGGLQASVNTSKHDDDESSSTSLAQRVLLRNASSTVSAPRSKSSTSSSSSAGSAAAPARRASTRNSPAPRRPGAVAWKDLTSTFKLGPGATLQTAAPTAVTSTAPVVTSVVSASAAAALDSFKAAYEAGGPKIKPRATSSTGPSMGRPTETSVQMRTVSSRGGASTSSEYAAEDTPASSVATQTANGAVVGTSIPNGHKQVPIRPHPNAQFATEVLGPPPSSLKDVYYPPLTTTYTGAPAPGTQPNPPKASVQHGSAGAGSSHHLDSLSSTAGTSASSGGAAGATSSTAPSASSSRVKRSAVSINQGSNVGHGAGPAVVPSSVVQALGLATDKGRARKSRREIASNTAPRTTRARSLADSASATPSPSLPTVGLPPMSASGSATRTMTGVDAAVTPPLTPSHSASLMDQSVLGLGATDAALDNRITVAADTSASALKADDVDDDALPESKRRKILAPNSQTAASGRTPMLAEHFAHPGGGQNSASTSVRAATINDDLDLILASRRAQPSVCDPSKQAEGSTRALDQHGSLPSAASTSSPARQTTSSLTYVTGSSQEPTPANASGSQGSTGGTPVKRPRITVKRNGVLAPPPLSMTTEGSVSALTSEVPLSTEAGPSVLSSASASQQRLQSTSGRAESPSASTRARRGAGTPGPSTHAMVTGRAGPHAGATGVTTRASTPSRSLPTAMSYPPLGASAHMSGSPQKGNETVGIGMTANGTLAIAPAAEFAAAAAAGGHLSVVQGSLLGGPGVVSTSEAMPGEKETNLDYCDACKGHGRFLCCDGCVRSFHPSCISPPVDLDEVTDMDDAWYCNLCRSSRRPSSKPPKGLFGRLIHQLEQTNPVQYELPADIRTYFKGVGTAVDGSYLNIGMIRPLRVNKQGLIEDRDPYRLKDKNGKAVLCFRCGGSALPAMPHSSDLLKVTMSTLGPPSTSNNTRSQQATTPTPDGTWRRILSCDFCTAHWHLDCVTPPLAVMPNMTRKWMCPNHADHAMKQVRVPKAASAIQPYALPYPTRDNIGKGKLYKVRLRNNGDVDIIPDPTDSFFNQDGSSNSATRPGWEEMIVGGTNPNGAGQRFRYRVPEKVVRLDFWNRVKANVQPVAVRFGRPTQESDPVLALDDLAEVAMERLRKERVLASVRETGSEADEATVKLVSRVFKDDGDELTDFPPARGQRAYEEAVERARVHGVVGIGGGILLSKLEDAPTVSERTTSNMDDGAPTNAMLPDTIVNPSATIKVEEASSPLASSAGENLAKVAYRQEQTGATAMDSSRLVPPTGRPTPHNLRATTPERKAGHSASSDGASSPASTLTDLSSDDGGSDNESWKKTNDRGGESAADRRASSLLDAYGLTEKDVERLLAIEQLMKVKGESAMLEFLLQKS